MTRHISLSVRAALAMVLLLIGTWFVYEPGLQGSFIFDDFTNLAPLGARGGVVNWESFVHYIRSGFSGPTGRPLSLVTFLIDANNWPADPESFKRTNILIHLLNGCLLFWLVLVLLSVADPQISSGKRTSIALTVSALWLLHPYLVSTTLYVVQRMAMLAACFVFSGLIVWIKGRALLETNPRHAYLQMSFGLLFFSILAVLSKENGAVLPAMALAIEFLLFKKSANIKYVEKWWVIFFLIVPAILVGAYLLYVPISNGFFSDYASRDFSPWERLLTQARVLWIYVGHWFIPEMTTTGLFHDHLVVSKSIISPWTTLVAVFAWGLVSIISWKIRHRLPLVAASISVWAISVLIESSTIGLEMLFEHRMYLGGAFLFLPIVYYLINFATKWKALLSLSFILMVFAFFCWRGASLWGHYPTMIMVWSEKAPESARAQIEVARMLYETGNRSRALDYLNEASARIPNDFPLRMSQMLVRCRVKELTSGDLEILKGLALEQKYSHRWFNLMQRSLEWSAGSDCRGIDPVFIGQLALHFLNQGRNWVGSQGYAQLTYLYGISLIYADQLNEARVYLDKSIESRRDAQKMMSSAAYLATFGHYEAALHYAALARKVIIDGNLNGRALGEAPELRDIDDFIEAVKTDEEKKIEHRHSREE